MEFSARPNTTGTGAVVARLADDFTGCVGMLVETTRTSADRYTSDTVVRQNMIRWTRATCLVGIAVGVADNVIARLWAGARIVRVDLITRAGHR